MSTPLWLALAFLLLAPIQVAAVIDGRRRFRRWKARYGEHLTLIEWRLRWWQGRLDVDHPWHVAVVKVALVLVWFLLVATLLLWLR